MTTLSRSFTVILLAPFSSVPTFSPDPDGSVSVAAVPRSYSVNGWRSFSKSSACECTPKRWKIVER